MWFLLIFSFFRFKIVLVFVVLIELMLLGAINDFLKLPIQYERTNDKRSLFDNEQI